MIPHYDTENTSKVAAFDRAQREWNTPPFPIGEADQVETVLTARHVWLQAVPDREPSSSGWASSGEEAKRLRREAGQRLARRVAATSNPLRELAATLTDFADQLDEHGMVPLAINLTTGHPAVYEAIGSDHPSRLAQVHVTVRGLRKQWVDEHTADTTTERSA